MTAVERAGLTGEERAAMRERHRTIDRTLDGSFECAAGCPDYPCMMSRLLDALDEDDRRIQAVRVVADTLRETLDDLLPHERGTIDGRVILGAIDAALDSPSRISGVCGDCGSATGCECGRER